MTKGYLGKTINKGPTPSVIFPEGCSDIFKNRENYIIRKSGNSVIITPYSDEEIIGKFGERIEETLKMPKELLTFRHIEVDLGE